MGCPGCLRSWGLPTRSSPRPSSTPPGPGRTGSPSSNTWPSSQRRFGRAWQTTSMQSVETPTPATFFATNRGGVTPWVVGLVALVAWQIAYALDCADGQLARVGGRTSAAGGRVDVLCDV